MESLHKVPLVRITLVMVWIGTVLQSGLYHGDMVENDLAQRRPSLHID